MGAGVVVVGAGVVVVVGGAVLGDPLGATVVGALVGDGVAVCSPSNTNSKISML